MKHPGFKAVQSKIQSEGYSKKAAGAILANATRKASPAAKKANPRLKKVKGNHGTMNTPKYSEFSKHLGLVNSHLHTGGCGS